MISRQSVEVSGDIQLYFRALAAMCISPHGFSAKDFLAASFHCPLSTLPASALSLSLPPASLILCSQQQPLPHVGGTYHEGEISIWNGGSVTESLSPAQPCCTSLCIQGGLELLAGIWYTVNMRLL